MSLRDHLHGRGQARKMPHDTSNKKVGLLGVALVVAIGAAIAVYLKGESVRVETDPATLCAIDRPPSELLVLLLDLSDGYSEPQLLQIRNSLSRSISSVQKLGLIEAYSVDRVGERVTKSVIQLCNPGTDKDVNQIYQNPKQAKERWNGFSERLNEALKQLMSTAKAPTSPIFEAVQSVAIQSLNAPRFDGVPKRLIVVSDLLQNVPKKLSHYKGVLAFETFKQSAYFSDIRADLTGTEIQLLYLVRPGTPQNAEHLQFWEKYFTQQGGRVIEVIPIYGAH